MIRRSVPAEWLHSPPSFLRSFIADSDLFPEIRDNSITVYYQGKALIRDLTLRDGQVSGSISLDYIPQARTDTRYATVVFGESGFEYSPMVSPLRLGNLDPDTLRHFKARMVGRGPEGDLVHRLVIRSSNLIVDQEIAFQDSGERGFDKVDLCVFDPRVNAFSFVEVKTIVDGRLFPLSVGQVPEVIEQLQRYKARIEQNSSALIETFCNVVQMKRRLGMELRLAGIPQPVPTSIVSRPALVIGNCSKTQVQEILAGVGSWKPLMDALPSVASGLIVCGGAGANLELNASGSQTIVFDSSTTH
ncbi:MAG TPA: hypothetical protein DDZ51_17745 [Planctomycetaceae bacterium]|nr:hypothetical protein [Planctomycetaceae bacterium]